MSTERWFSCDGGGASRDAYMWRGVEQLPGDGNAVGNALGKGWMGIAHVPVVELWGFTDGTWRRGGWGGL